MLLQLLLAALVCLLSHTTALVDTRISGQLNEPDGPLRGLPQHTLGSTSERALAKDNKRSDQHRKDSADDSTKEAISPLAVQKPRLPGAKVEEQHKKEQEAVLYCWKATMDGTYTPESYKLAERPIKKGFYRIAVECTAEQSGYTIKDIDAMWEEHLQVVEAEDVVQAPEADSAAPKLLGTLGYILAHNRALYRAKHPETVAVVEEIVRKAKALGAAPDETVTSKTIVPPTGDKRTYMSLATYCWPSNPEDLENPKGPWNCKDAVPFPGRKKIAPDHEMLLRVLDRVYAASLAYYFTGDERHAERAAAPIRKFFLNKKTGMLPSLMYAQVKPGHKGLGAATGTIDFKNVYMLTDAIAMLKGSKHWKKRDDRDMHVWMTEYVKHLQSDHVRAERVSNNNHGTYFDVQYLTILRYLRRDTQAIEYVNSVVKERHRMEVQGSMLPAELIRPKSYAYVNFQLGAFARLAVQVEALGIDLWRFRAEEGNSILDAWDWMGPHWCDRAQTMWPVEQMKDFPLEIMPAPRWMGAVYTATSSPHAYTQRSLYYAKLFHSFRDGHDPHGEMDWGDALMHQLATVKMDSGFITLDPNNTILDEDSPTFDAPCAPLTPPQHASSATKNMKPWSSESTESEQPQKSTKVAKDSKAPQPARAALPTQPRRLSKRSPSDQARDRFTQKDVYNYAVLCGLLTVVLAAVLVALAGATPAHARKLCMLASAGKEP